MISVKATEGKEYDAKRHFGMWGMQKIVAGQQSKRVTVSTSYFLPNGGAEMCSSPAERIYMVLEGSITVCGPNEKHVLEAGDIIYIAPGEDRDMAVNNNTYAKVMVFVINVD